MRKRSFLGYNSTVSLEAFIRSMIFLVLIFGTTLPVLAGLTHPGAPPAFSHPPKFPAKPSASSLKKVLLPDLAITSVSWKPAEQAEASKAWITVKVKNVGKATSKPTSLAGVHTCNGKAISKKSFNVKALKPGASLSFRWLIACGVGENEVFFTIRDAINNSNNKNRVHFQYALPLRSALIRKSGVPVGMRKSHRAVKKPLLTIREVAFQDTRPKKPDESWIRVVVKNDGKAESPHLNLSVTITLPKGEHVKKHFPVGPIRPGRQAVVEGAIRMGQGINQVRVALLPVSKSAITSYQKGGIIVTKSHYFNVRTVSKQALGVTKGQKPLLVEKQSLGKATIKPVLKSTPYGGTVSSPPDLKIVSMQAYDSHNEVHWIVRVVNIGGDYPQDSRIKIVGQFFIRGPLGKEPLKKVTSAQHLAPVTQNGREVELVYKFTPPVPGQYWNKVRVKFSQYVGEKNFQDNVGEKFHIAYPLPDLRVWISSPSDVRVGGPKRWFRFYVKNTGGSISRETTLRLHIDGDGTHTYTVPPLHPGQTFPAHGAKKRGIRWWKKGRKHYRITVNQDRAFEEAHWHNNTIEDSLYVYNPKVVFDPKAKVLVPIDVALKNHAPYVVGETSSITFKFFNFSNRALSDKYRFKIKIVYPSPSLREKLLTFDVGPLMPGESIYKTAHANFDYAGRALYSIKRFVFLKNGHDYKEFPLDNVQARGAIEVLPQVGEAATSPQLGTPPQTE